jgi:hypothetical protein
MDNRHCYNYHHRDRRNGHHCVYGFALKNTLETYLVGETEAEKILDELAEAKKREEMFNAFPTADWEKKSVLDELEELARRLERLQARTGT